MAYDGYGRLSSRHVPEQNIGTATVWTYNADDTVNTVTDARGAVTTFGYAGTNRHLVKTMTYTLTGSPTVSNSFTYDAAGNRTGMTDGLGSVDYSYSLISQLTSETRAITGVGSFTLNYTYTVSGQLSRITDPFGAQVDYSHDNAGRLRAITGANFASVSTYASSLQYRAWDAVKSLTYGNSKTLAVGYDANLRALSYEIPGVMKKSYQYYDDGRLKFTQDQLTSNSKFDRLYKYDHAERITTALSGAEARGGGPTNDRPYNENMGYDALGHLTLRELRHWDRWDTTGNETYTNNRRFGWLYDADGRLLSGRSQYTYDAAGQIASFGDEDPYMTDQQLDGDGRRIKSLQRILDPNTNQWTTEKVTYYIHSSVLGQVVSEVSAQGVKERSFVFAGSNVIAVQSVFGSSQAVGWKHDDSSGGSYRATNSVGGLSEWAERDPLGADAGIMKPLVWPQQTSPGKLAPYYGVPDLNSPYQGCELSGIPAPCNVVLGSGNGSDGAFSSMADFFNPLRPLGPGVDWYPGFLNWVDQKKYKLTAENHLSLGGEWVNFMAMGADIDEQGIQRLVLEALAAPGCADFAKTVLEAQQRQGLGTISDVAKAFFALSGPHFTRRQPLNSTFGIANPIGRISTGTAQIYSLGNDASLTANEQMLTDADNAIGELFHLAAEGSHYSDKALATAVSRSNYASDAYKPMSNRKPLIDPRSNIFDKNYIPNKKDENDRPNSYSRYFHTIQLQYCTSKPGAERGVGYSPPKTK